MAKRTQKIENPFVDVQAGAKAVREEIVLTQAVIDSLNKDLAITRTNATALKTSLGDKSGGNLSNMQAVNTAMAQAVELHKQETAIIKAKASQEQQLIKLYDKAEQERSKRVAKELADNAKKEAVYNKEIQKVEQLTKKIEQQGTAYNRVNGWLNKLSQEHKNLAIRQELGIKLTADETKRMETLTGRIQRYDTALKNVDATQGKHQRNVGNYKSAFNGLGVSINQITRELPAVGVSFQTFILGISNNIPMLQDEIQKIVLANKELTASGQPTTSVFKQIATQFFSLTSLISLGTTALVLFSGAIADWFSGSEKSQKQLEQERKQQELLNKERNKSAEFVARESFEYVGYLLQLKKTNAGSKDRSDLISEINEKYGVTIKNLKDEAKFQALVNNEINNYLTFQRLKYEAQRNEEFIQKNLENQDKARLKLFKDLGITRKQLMLLEAIGSKGYIDMQNLQNNVMDVNNDLYKEQNSEINKNADALLQHIIFVEKSKDRLDNYGLSLLNINAQLDTYDYKTEKATKSLEANNTQMDENNVTLSDYIENLKRLDAIVKELGDIEIDFRIKILDETILAENENIRRKILAGEEYSRDAINKLYNDRFDLQSRLLENEYSFKVKLAQDSFNDEKRIAKEGLIEQKNKLIEDINESKWGAERKANDRLAVEKNYQIEVEKLELLFKERQKTIDAEKIKDKVDFESKVYDLSKQTKEATNKLNEDVNQFEKDRLDGRISEIDDYYKYEKLKLLESKKTKEQISEEELINKRAELEEKIWILEQEGKETTDLKIQLAELNRSLNEKKLAEEKKYYDEILKIGKKSADELLEYQIKKSQERQKILDGNISASEKESDILAQKASQGNLLAEESLKKQQEITNKYRDQRRQEEEKEQALQQAKKYVEIALNITNSLIQKGGEPITSAGKSIGLVSVIKGLFGKGFFFGTDDTGSDSPVKDGYGKITGFTHENEQVWSKQDRADVGFASRKELKRAWDFMHSQNMIMPKISPQTDVTHAPILKAQLRKLDEVSSKLDNIPKEFFSSEVIDGVLTAVHIKQSGNTTNKRYIGS